MDLKMFLQSLSTFEKRKLSKLLLADLNNRKDTVQNFIDSLDDGGISIRTLNILKRPQMVNLFLDEITEENCMSLGFGQKSYPEFDELRKSFYLHS